MGLWDMAAAAQSRSSGRDEDCESIIAQLVYCLEVGTGQRMPGTWTSTSIEPTFEVALADAKAWLENKAQKQDLKHLLAHPSRHGSVVSNSSAELNAELLKAIAVFGECSSNDD